MPLLIEGIPLKTFARSKNGAVAISGPITHTKH
eukprot:CAMPEP_0183732758 /NCGR_PEP_ID=MMETSP0737-20130205/39293_1 /TAXON_ID=385413 /ORGANISM="Thalassiosira miniscula, Strain CCMP1093" /LENGTH=32 /DNA_ID= /DNA_START= /DNA_END= /DNA_ORIENTATION=